MLPDSCKTKRFSFLWINSITNDIPNPVIKAYIKSLVAAPNPVAIPYLKPFFRARLIQSIPTGPIGAETMMPMKIPFSISSNVLIGSISNINVKLG